MVDCINKPKTLQSALELISAALLCCILPLWADAADPPSLRIASWNVENYLIQNRIVDGRWRPDHPKPEIEKANLRCSIIAVAPDILAVQEIGGDEFITELQNDLKHMGHAYPYSATAAGEDALRQIGLLSRLPILEVRVHSDLSFNYFSQTISPRRALLEVHIDAGSTPLIIFVLHLKSQWSDHPDDPQSRRRRLAEATAQRNRIASRTAPKSSAYVIIGDFNDTLASPTLARYLTRGNTTLAHRLDPVDPSGQRWTQHWAKQDVYSRFDYILVSPYLLPAYISQSARIADSECGYASDHRMIYADFNLAKIEQVTVASPTGSSTAQP